MTIVEIFLVLLTWLASSLFTVWCIAASRWRAIASLGVRQDHLAPHPEAGFEGYYMRTQLQDGGTLAIIFCWVRNAPKRPNLVHVSYTPPANEGAADAFPAFKHEFFPESHHVSFHEPPSPDRQQPFRVTISGVGTMTCSADAVEIAVSSAEAALHLTARFTKRVPWSANDTLAGPMGCVARISALLPLNWHVYSTASTAAISISHAGQSLEVTGVTHIEKNWGASFPHGWIWSQSFATASGEGGGKGGGRSVCLAGGAALPFVEAYLVGYRSRVCNWDFRPPLAMAVGPLSPFMRASHDSKAGTFNLTVQTFSQKLIVRVSAPAGSYIGLACPLSSGHEPMFAFESFQAQTWVEAWVRRWPWETWVLLEEGVCGLNEAGVPCAALEFGGSYSHLVRDKKKV